MGESHRQFGRIKYQRSKAARICRQLVTGGSELPGANRQHVAAAFSTALAYALVGGTFLMRTRGFVIANLSSFSLAAVISFRSFVRQTH